MRDKQKGRRGVRGVRYFMEGAIAAFLIIATIKILSSVL